MKAQLKCSMIDCDNDARWEFGYDGQITACACAEHKEVVVWLMMKFVSGENESETEKETSKDGI